jgi:hypothetical protein
MDQEKILKFAIWMLGVSAGFLLRGNLFRGDDFMGYLSSIMLLVVGLIFVLKKPDVKK